MNELQITAVLFEPALEDWNSSTRRGSIGLALDDGTVVWGDMLGSVPIDPLVDTASQIHDAVSHVLTGQGMNKLDLVACLEQLNGTLGHDHAFAKCLRLGIEQALVAGLAQANRCTRVEVLASAYPSGGNQARDWTRLIVEVDNHAATIAVVQEMIALGTDGVGYRLASGDVRQSIGAQAQHLQRFVRELGMLLTRRDYPTPDPPTIYLGLGGALGLPTADPWRELGKVLGHCAGLEKAVGPLSLWLEDPLIIEDEVLNAAALQQLRDYMRVREMRSRLFARARAQTLEELQMLCDTDAIDGACLLIDEWGSLVRLFAAIEMLRKADKSLILGYGNLIAVSQLDNLLDLGQVVDAQAILVSMQGGEGLLADEAKIAFDRKRSWHAYHGQSDIPPVS